MVLAQHPRNDVEPAALRDNARFIEPLVPEKHAVARNERIVKVERDDFGELPRKKTEGEVRRMVEVGALRVKGHEGISFSGPDL